MDYKKRKRIRGIELRLQEFILKNSWEDEVKEEEIAYVLSKLAFSYSSVLIREEVSEGGRE